MCLSAIYFTLLGKLPSLLGSTYTLGGEVISSISEAKYLGVTLSNNYGTRSSQWKPHILDTVSRANQRLGFLRRNLRGSPYKLRETAYLALVRSSLEYCGAIWDPSGKEESLEDIQRRAARPLDPRSPWDYFCYCPFERPWLAKFGGPAAESAFVSFL